MYKCKDCGKQFIGGERRNKSQVITDYIEGKQTQLQLAVKYNISERTVRRDLKEEGFRWHAIHKQYTYQCNVVLPYKSLVKNKGFEIYQK